jgi:hypothetical protein
MDVNLNAWLLDDTVCSALCQSLRNGVFPAISYSRVEKFITVLVVEATEQGRKECVKIIKDFIRT